MDFLAVEAFDLLYFFELHSFNLAALLEDELVVMAELAGIEYLAAGGFDVAWVSRCVQFLR